MKSLFISGREINYPRNQLFISALQEISNLEVIGKETDDISKGGIYLILRQSLGGLLKALFRGDLNNFSFVFVGFLGHILIIILDFFVKVPLLFDVFVSTYDTLVNDRRLINQNSLIAKILYFLDKQSCKNADLVFIDTQSHARFFHRKFSIPLEKMHAIYVGCDEEIFFPRNVEVDETKILYYCSYLPLHGVDVVVRAAKILQNDVPIKFKIIGNGMEAHRVRDLANSLNVTNIEFLDSVPVSKIADEIASSLICLGGHFGVSEKAKYVIPGKIFQLIAMRKPVIVGENDANHELLTHNKDAWFCEMNNPEALAKSIYTLYNDQSIRDRLGKGGYETYQRKASNKVLKGQIQNVVLRYLSDR